MSAEPEFYIGDRTLRRVEFNTNNELAGEYSETNTGDVVTDPAEATVVSSDLPGEGGYWHMPVIDIDFPVRAVPSSTEGHTHLYIDKAMPWWQFQNLLDALVQADLVQVGYAEAAKRRGHSDVRLPWVRKVAEQ